MSNTIIPTREQLCDYIYYRHKDAYGVKGRHYDFDSMSYAELEAEAKRIDEAADEQYKYERKIDAEAVRIFRMTIRNVRDICGCDRRTAIRYMIEEYAGEYDPSYVCYSMRLPYSMAKYIEPALRELNESAPEEEFAEAYDEMEVAA
jgi:hypothetical protein